MARKMHEMGLTDGTTIRGRSVLSAARTRWGRRVTVIRQNERVGDDLWYWNVVVPPPAKDVERGSSVVGTIVASGDVPSGLPREED